MPGLERFLWDWLSHSSVLLTRVKEQLTFIRHLLCAEHSSKALHASTHLLFSRTLGGEITIITIIPFYWQERWAVGRLSKLPKITWQSQGSKSSKARLSSARAATSTLSYAGHSQGWREVGGWIESQVRTQMGGICIRAAKYSCSSLFMGCGTFFFLLNIHNCIEVIKWLGA
jgi:hypothetical protein